MQSTRVVPAAASVRVDTALWGRPTTARVLAALPAVLYLGLDRHESVLPVLTRGALALPCGIRVAADVDPLAAPDRPWGVEQGSRVEVGGGRVHLPSGVVAAVRTWQPRRVPVLPRDARAIPAIPTADLSEPLRDLARDLVHAAVRGRDVTRYVRALVGAGPGLTPSGDDALCGVLLILHALGPRIAGAEQVRQEVRARLPATTSLSAALLREAEQGYAVPAVVRLVAAATAGHRESADLALRDVLDIGHSSGRDLVAGLVGALDVLPQASVTPLRRAARRSPVPAGSPRRAEGVWA